MGRRVAAVKPANPMMEANFSQSSSLMLSTSRTWICEAASTRSTSTSRAQSCRVTFRTAGGVSRAQALAAQGRAQGRALAQTA